MNTNSLLSLCAYLSVLSVGCHAVTSQSDSVDGVVDVALIQPQQDSHNDCNSPLYGKHIAEVSTCKRQWHMREDCIVDYFFPPHYRDDFAEWGRKTTYDGLEVRLGGNRHVFFSDPLINPESQRDYNEIKAVIKKMNRYGGGYFLLEADGVLRRLARNAFVVVDSHDEGLEICENGP